MEEIARSGQRYPVGENTELSQQRPSERTRRVSIVALSELLDLQRRRTGERAGKLASDQ